MSIMDTVRRYRKMERDNRTLPPRDPMFSRYLEPREMGAKMARWGWPWNEALDRCRFNRMDEGEFAEGYHRWCLHFVGFRGSEYRSAQKVWGPPDFIHRHWDHRAVGDIAPGDVVVFAKETERDTPRPFAFNDSEHF